MSVTFYIEGCPDDGPELNIANANAQALLEVLGMPAEDSDVVGSAEPDDLIFKISMAHSIDGIRPFTDNHGIELSEHGVRATARWIDCGCTADQIRRYLQELARIATAAAEARLKVFWA